MFILEKFSHFLGMMIGNILFRIPFKFRVEGIEILRNTKGPVVLVYNHVSWLDAFFLMTAVPLNARIAPLVFAVKEVYYNQFKFWLKMAGAFSVVRKLGLENTLKKGLEALENGRTVAIAPEGKVRHTGRRRRGRRGAAFLATKANCPVLPLYINGGMGLREVTLSNFIPGKRKIIVKVGQPFSLPEKNIEKPSDLNQFADLIIERLYDLEDKNR